MTITEELIEHVKNLDLDQQHYLLRVISILETHKNTRGEPGTSIVQSTGLFDKSALDEMEAVINEGCEEIDWRDWE